MGRQLIAVLAALVGFSAAALATDLNLTVEALGCHSSEVTVGPSCDTPYRVVGELTDADSDGLAMIVFDLEFDGGTLSPVNTPVVPPMTSFAPPDGLSNPGGFGGVPTPVGGNLVGVGGSQNVVGHGQWPCEIDDDCPDLSTCADEICTSIPGLPIGTVVLGVAQPGAPASIAIGAATAPATSGTYSIQVTNPVGTVFEKGVDGRPYWWNETVNVSEISGLSITVEAGRVCCDVYEACCLSDASCTYLPPTECVDLGGVRSGLVWEGDNDGDGVDGNCGDQCPNDPNKTEPGVCGCDVPDTDTDGDTVLDCNDGCPLDPNKTEPGFCGCGEPEDDSDNDGTPDCIDGCPFDPNKTSPGECGCDVPEDDSDNDGTPDCNDQCPYDPNKTEPGECGCNVPDTDSDGDTVADCNDVCPGEDDLIDDNGNGIPDCWETPDVPALANWKLVTLALLFMAAFWFYLGRRREA
jgi:hypothetical protein